MAFRKEGSLLYTPFFYKNGNPIYMENLRYQHLVQLADIEEGYKIEYKEKFDTSVKKKIPSIISSFANSDGGWLFIGIKDDDHTICPIQKQRSDYSQTISQILKEHVSPIPQFECKFLRNPQNHTEGVLTVYIYPGLFTPYVSNGTIFIRNGSSSEPIKSERATIEYLFKKADTFQDNISQFCHRDIYFPYDKIIHGEKFYDYVICNIYFKNLFSSSENRLFTQTDIDKLWGYATQNNLFQQIQRSQESIVLWHKQLNPTGENSVTAVLEIFPDLSVKIHIPIWPIQNFDNTLFTDIKHSGYIFDGLTATNCVYGTIFTACKMLEEFKRRLDQFVFCMELENCENAILYFEGETYQHELKQNGLCFSCKPIVKSKFINFINTDLNWDMIPSWAVQNYFLPSFGRQAVPFHALVDDSMKIRFPDLYK